MIHVLPASLWAGIEEQIGGTEEDTSIRVLAGDNAGNAYTVIPEEEGPTLERLNRLEADVVQDVGEGFETVSYTHLDVYKRQGDGLCRWIREQWPALPLMFLTGRGESRDIVGGFENGADDYVVKPFELEVLYSRIQALLRRAGQTASGTGERGKLCCGGLTLDTERMRVFSGGKEVALSQPEYQLFQILMENTGRTVTRARLLEQILSLIHIFHRPASGRYRGAAPRRGNPFLYAYSASGQRYDHGHYHDAF